jgi:hypothetical protein
MPSQPRKSRPHGQLQETLEIHPLQMPEADAAGRHSTQSTCHRTFPRALRLPLAILGGPAEPRHGVEVQCSAVSVPEIEAYPMPSKTWPRAKARRESPPSKKSR